MRVFIVVQEVQITLLGSSWTRWNSDAVKIGWNHVFCHFHPGTQIALIGSSGVHWNSDAVEAGHRHVPIFVVASKLGTTLRGSSCDFSGRTCLFVARVLRSMP